MNYNVESHFAELPRVDVPRSIMNIPFNHKFSANIGQVIPFYWSEVLPGDTWQVSTSLVTRLQTLLTPIMDNIYAEVLHFFVPTRLTWEGWKQFLGESQDNPWLPSSEKTVPILKAPSGGFAFGSVADYMGIPPGVEYPEDDAPIALPIRAAALCIQEWFRDQNLQQCLNIPLGDESQQGSNGTDYITDLANGGMPFVAAKFHDYFTSSLPAPQRSANPVGFDLAASFSGSMPVYGASTDNWAKDTPVHGAPIHFFGHHTITPESGDPYDAYLELTGSSNHNAALSGSGNLGYQGAPATTGFNSAYPVNLIADPTNAAITGLSFTINELRLAFQLQKFYEKSARGGMRYREIIRENFGTIVPDYRSMVPEFLGGHRFPLSIHQVANQSQGANDFLGDLGAMSNTFDNHDGFVKSFSEAGYIVSFLVCRYDHSYPQGLERSWSRKTKLDYFWPVFSAIGERATLAKEIMLTDDTSTNNRVFGYQEAWAEYRYKPNRVSGEMRPTHPTTLASWHLADNYASVPYLDGTWIQEDKTNVDRVLAVTSQVSNQLFVDAEVDAKVTRPMPVYSIPGLIDHF